LDQNSLRILEKDGADAAIGVFEGIYPTAHLRRSSESARSGFGHPLMRVSCRSSFSAENPRRAREKRWDRSISCTHSATRETAAIGMDSAMANFSR
jgi:hypothetical protein